MTKGVFYHHSNLSQLGGSLVLLYWSILCSLPTQVDESSMQRPKSVLSDQGDLAGALARAMQERNIKMTGRTP